MQKKILFLDGLMIPASKAFMESLSPGILSGKGVFETMRVYEGRIFALKEHLARLFEGLDYLKIKLPFPKEKMGQHLDSSLHTNRLKDARIRLTVWQADRRPRISIIVLPYRSYPQAKYEEGFQAVIADIRRDQSAKLSRIKSINYLPLALALRKAKSKGNDEAILLNRKGFLVEGSRSNIFFIKDNTLYTPSLSCGCLNGITRQIILKISKKVKVACREVKAFPEDIFKADEAFLTNSLIEVMPLTCLQGRLVGHGKMGVVSAKLLKEYRNLVKGAVR